MQERVTETLTLKGPAGSHPRVQGRAGGTWLTAEHACMKGSSKNWLNTTAMERTRILLSLYLLAFSGVPFCWLS